jgi:hypothetical protein
MIAGCVSIFGTSQRAEDTMRKGSHHSIYYPHMNEAGLRQFIAEQLLRSLMKNFPNEMNEAIKKYTG